MAELGNGEVFIFDAGAGTNLSFNHMRVPYHKATKFFMTHYHIDHIADLIVYYDFGQSNGRLEPMNVYGPPVRSRSWALRRWSRTSTGWRRGTTAPSSGTWTSVDSR